MPHYPDCPLWVRSALLRGLVIPAHPLALDADRQLDVRHQRALTRYYHAAGAGGVAVGVHTTQFAIRDPKHDLLRSVLSLASETVADCDAETGRRTVRIAGVVGSTDHAVREACLARDLDYHAGLLSLAALRKADEDTLIAHCRAVAEVLPLVGFYLQPAVGGRELSYTFWRRFLDIPNVVAIKIAPFDRYKTLDVVRAVAESGRAAEVALYTGNDDHIVLDLLTPYTVPASHGTVTLRFAGGLLGHWACWTRRAVELLHACHTALAEDSLPTSLLSLGAQVTDCNAAFFDAARGFAGSIAGIHEVLRRQGLMANRLCLNPEERLSPGQMDAIDRVLRMYPHLNDDAFVSAHLDEWLR